MKEIEVITLDYRPDPCNNCTVSISASAQKTDIYQCNVRSVKKTEMIQDPHTAKFQKLMPHTIHNRMTEV